MPKSRPIALALSLVAAAQAFMIAAAQGDWLNEDQISIANAVVGAAAVFLAVYLANTNTENKDVAVVMSGATPMAGHGSASTVETGSVLPQSMTIEQVTPPPPSDPARI